MAVNRVLLYKRIELQEPPQSFEVPLEPLLGSLEDALRSDVVKVTPLDPFDFGEAAPAPPTVPRSHR